MAHPIQYLVTDVRLYGEGKAIDIVWTHVDERVSLLPSKRDVNDMLELPLKATDDEILKALEARREEVIKAFDVPNLEKAVAKKTKEEIEDENKLPPTNLIGMVG